MLKTNFRTSDDLDVFTDVFPLIASGSGISRETIQIHLGVYCNLNITLTPGQIKIQVADPYHKLQDPVLETRGRMQMDDIIIRRKDK